jgi:hypothetical protein
MVPLDAWLDPEAEHPVPHCPGFNVTFKTFGLLLRHYRGYHGRDRTIPTGDKESDGGVDDIEGDDDGNNDNYKLLVYGENKEAQWGCVFF